MKSSIDELQNIIGKIPLKRIILDKDESIQSIFLQHGDEGIRNLLHKEQEPEITSPLQIKKTDDGISTWKYPKSDKISAIEFLLKASW